MMRLFRRQRHILDQDIQRELTRDAGAASFRRVREVEMRYRRQGHELRVPVPAGEMDIDALEEAFHQVHRDRFGYSMEGDPVIIVNALLTLIIGEEQGGTGASSEAASDDGHARPVWFDKQWIETRVVTRASLPLGAQAVGPLIVEQTDTTVVLPPGTSLTVDEHNNLVISVDADTS